MAMLDSLFNETGSNNTSDDGLPNTNFTNVTGIKDHINIIKDPFPSHKVLWRVGIIFAVTGIIVLGSFIAMYGFSYTRRRLFYRRRRRRANQTLAFENQMSVTEDENLQQTRSQAENIVIPVHSSCGINSRRWSRSEDMPRSRSNSRSRSLSPSHAQSRNTVSPPRPRSPSDLDDEQTHTGLEKLDNARLAFRDDAARYTEYDSTKDRVNA